MLSDRPEICSREIVSSDIPDIADLLARGFPKRNRQFWVDALENLARHQPPPGFPKYGHVMESSGAPVGAILTIFSAIRVGKPLKETLD